MPLSVKGAGTGASPSQNARRIPVGVFSRHYRLTGCRCVVVTVAWLLTRAEAPNVGAAAHVVLGAELVVRVDVSLCARSLWRRCAGAALVAWFLF